MPSLSIPASHCLLLLPCLPITAPDAYSPIVATIPIAASTTSARSSSSTPTAASSSAAAAVPSTSYIASKGGNPPTRQEQVPQNTAFLRSLASMRPKRTPPVVMAAPVDTGGHIC